MLFNSIEFLLFLPIVFLLYWFVFKSVKWQNAFIVISSYIFYGWWNWRFVVLIAITTICSYAFGLIIVQKQQFAKLACALNIIINITILGIFKYYNFFADTFASMLTLVGLSVDIPTLNLILPVGISFYTFQALNYTIDVYRKQINATNDILAFFAFISFFPQLVAGPIERANNLLPQIQKSRQFSYSKAIEGLRQMLWGFFKKMVIADNCAMAVNQIWADYSHQSSFSLIIGAVLFSMQIYGDFSGYSDIAIGCARLFGIELMQNFRYPYFSENIGDFWRRWHISLMTWFRDYIYIPLGGNRKGKIRTMCNSIIVFLISGLWHGANWTFVCWGAFHALLMCIQRLIPKSKNTETYNPIPRFSQFIKIITTFTLVTFGWIIFRAESITQAIDYICRIFSPSAISFYSFAYGKKALIFSIILLSIEWLQRDKTCALQFPNRKIFRQRWVRVSIYYIIVIIIICCQGSQQTFIYFQF